MSTATTDTTTTSGTAAGRGRGMSIVAWICFVLAAVLTVPSAVAYWGQRTLNDTSRYVATVGPLIDDPAVQQAIATTVTNAIEKQVDVEATLQEAFSGLIAERPKLELLIGPLAGAIDGLIARTVDQVIASDQFADLWVAANTKAQQQLIAVLQGKEGGVVSLQGDQVVLDVSAVIDAVKERLVARGLTFIEKVPIPDVDKQVVLLTAPQLEQARTIYAFANPAASWLLWVVAGLYLLAFLLVRRRPRMVLAIGIALTLNALLMAWGLAVGQQLFVNELAGTTFGPASTVFWDQMLSFLVSGWRTFLWLGVVLIAAGWFAGANAPATGLRRATARTLESFGSGLGGTALAPAGRWVAANLGWLRWVVVALGWLVLLWGASATPERLAWSVLLVVVLLVVLQILSGARSAGPDDQDAGAGAVEAGAEAAPA